MLITSKLASYARLMRLDNAPIGIFLLLWPSLCALWLASEGHPSRSNVIIFVLGSIIMRSAGCIANDYADRKFDKFVKRTATRPLTCGQVSVFEAIVLLALLLSAALALVLYLQNSLVLLLALVGLAFALIYPWLKRITHLPQLGLSFAFSISVLMAFTAEQRVLTGGAWLVFFTFLLWPLIYDTMYAMADREEDLLIGVKSSAILFGQYDALIIGILQMGFLFFCILIARYFELNGYFYFALVVVGVLFIYQQFLLKKATPTHFLKAFSNNNWVGYVIFSGIILSYAA